MKKISRILAAMALFALPLLNTPLTSAAADTCTWTGAVDANWADGGNWTGCDNFNVPEDGDALIFPESASNKSVTNNLSPLSLTSIQISGSGYTLSGIGVTLTGTTPLIVNQNATIGLNITYAPSMNAFLRVSSTQTLTINGTTTFSGVTGEVNIGGGGFSGTIDFVGNINGDAGTQLIAVSSARAIVRGASNTYTASTVGAESSGVFECQSNTCFGNNANNIYSGNGTVELHVNNTFSNDWETSTPSAGTSSIVAHNYITITGTGNVNDPITFSQQLSGASLQFTGDITNTGGITILGNTTAAQIRINGSVSDAGNITVSSGTAHLYANSTYTGTTTVDPGAILYVYAPGSLGTTAGITDVKSGASLRIEFTSGSTISEPIQVVGSGIAGEGAIVMIDESATLSGNVTLAGNTTFGLDTTSLSAALMFSGVISGTGDVTATASNSTDYSGTSVQFTGASANTFVGSTTVLGTRFYPSKANNVVAVPGNLNVTATATKAAHAETAFSESIANTSIVTLTNNGPRVADLSIGSTATETIASLAGDGEISLGAQSILNLASNADYTFSGNISKFSNFPAGDSTIHKQGTGTATFTGGVNNTYGSFYPVIQTDAGTVKTNTSSFTNVPVIVASGSVLKGTGTIGATTVQSGGSINVGNSPGCMTLASLNLNNGATFTEEIAGSTACTDYDQTTVTGTADITNATLQISLTTTPADGQVFTILTAGSVVGTFSGLANGTNITVSGVTFRVNYTSTNVTLTKLAGTNTTTTTASLQSTGVGIAASVFAGITLITFAITLTKRKKELQA